MRKLEDYSIGDLNDRENSIGSEEEKNNSILEIEDPGFFLENELAHQPEEASPIEPELEVVQQTKNSGHTELIL